MSWVILIGVLLFSLITGFASVGSVACLIDTEQNLNNGFTTANSWQRTTLLNDSFESDPWDVNWNDNGNTTWQQASDKSYSGSCSAASTQVYLGLLTTDNPDASSAHWIHVSFWFYPDTVKNNDVLIQIYNGSTYDTWYDMKNYPGFQNGEWCYFSELIWDSQYFKSDFRLRFNSSGFDENERFYLDDVLIEKLVLP